MKWTNLDTITRRWLLENGLPIHYYLEGLVHGASAIRELSFDTLTIVRTVNLPVDPNTFAVNLPDDFVDDIAVSIPVGNLLQPIARKSNITPLRAKTAAGAYTTYANSAADAQTFFGINANWLWYWNVSDYGENTGRYFGASGGANQNGYAVFKERNQIQMTESFTSDEIVLMYISDGQSADDATNVDIRAQATIHAYINWKRSGSAAVNQSDEAQTYYNERRLLRARLNDLSVTDVRNILHESYRATIKV